MSTATEQFLTVIDNFMLEIRRVLKEFVRLIIVFLEWLYSVMK